VLGEVVSRGSTWLDDMMGRRVNQKRTACSGRWLSKGDADGSGRKRIGPKHGVPHDVHEEVFGPEVKWQCSTAVDFSGDR
jgi:hypothetical protein